MQMEGKVAVVTGGAVGIGQASARKLCELGARVAILDRDAKAGQELVAALKTSGYTASFFPCDVAIEAEVKAAIAATVALYGGLHILVSNAGIQTDGDIVSTTPEVWDETMNVHVKGCFHATKYAIPAMLASGGGAIVIVSSVQSFTAVNNSVAYVAAKHALLGIARAIALDLRPEISVRIAFARERSTRRCCAPLRIKPVPPRKCSRRLAGCTRLAESVDRRKSPMRSPSWPAMRLPLSPGPV